MPVQLVFEKGNRRLKSATPRLFESLGVVLLYEKKHRLSVLSKSFSSSIESQYKKTPMC